MKVIIVSGTNPLRAYSGLKYLTKSLTEKKVDVELRAIIPPSMLWEINDWDINLKSFYSAWYGRIPLFRRYMIHLHIFLTCLFTKSVVIFHELTYFRELVLLKKILPHKVVIHYCTELYTEEDVPKHKNLLKFYEKHANVPDLVIECDESREKLRKEMYKIYKPTVVIPNTLPMEEIPAKAIKGSLQKLAGVSFDINMPILIYTGGAFYHRQLDIIVEALSKIDKQIFFLAFCYGEEGAIEELDKMCNTKLKTNSYKICNAVPRQSLLACMGEATAGIVYYKPSLSIGNMYASPTKFFEYIGAGLPVISSNNPNLVELINKLELGVCVEDESVDALAKAIEELIFDEDKIIKIKENEDRYFKTKLCYEMATNNAFDQILKLINKESNDENNICK